MRALQTEEFASSTSARRTVHYFREEAHWEIFEIKEPVVEGWTSSWFVCTWSWENSVANKRKHRCTWLWEVVANERECMWQWEHCVCWNGWLCHRPKLSIQLLKLMFCFLCSSSWWFIHCMCSENFHERFSDALSHNQKLQQWEFVPWGFSMKCFSQKPCSKITLCGHLSCHWQFINPVAIANSLIVNSLCPVCVQSFPSASNRWTRNWRMIEPRTAWLTLMEHFDKKIVQCFHSLFCSQKVWAWSHQLDTKQEAQA